MRDLLESSLSDFPKFPSGSVEERMCKKIAELTEVRDQ